MQIVTQNKGLINLYKRTLNFFKDSICNNEKNINNKNNTILIVHGKYLTLSHLSYGRYVK